MPTLSLVIPHWPLDEDTNEALRRCVSSFPAEYERIVVVNDGTGYGRNVNIGLRLASGDYIAVVNNDCWLADGDLCDLCVPETVTSPVVIGERQGFGESIEPGGFHGSFWVVPRTVLDRVGVLDERFERAYWEDDDFLVRLRQAGIPTQQVASVRVRHFGGLTTVKIPEHRKWLELDARRFEEKWGGLPPPIPRYRRARGGARGTSVRTARAGRSPNLRRQLRQTTMDWTTSRLRLTAPSAKSASRSEVAANVPSTERRP